MRSPGKTSKHIKLDERNHVEEPLLDQLAGLGELACKPREPSVATQRLDLP